MNDASVAKLMFALHYLKENKGKNAPFTKVVFWKYAVEHYTDRVRARVMEHAFQFLLADVEAVEN